MAPAAASATLRHRTAGFDRWADPEPVSHDRRVLLL
jgi:hypothetical protein